MTEIICVLSGAVSVIFIGLAGRAIYRTSKICLKNFVMEITNERFISRYVFESLEKGLSENNILKKNDDKMGLTGIYRSLYGYDSSGYYSPKKEVKKSKKKK